MKKTIMLGNEAIARGAYEAGVKVSAAYPGTPSTEISEQIVKYKDSIYAEWSPNEKVATEVAIGASVSGGCGRRRSPDPGRTYGWHKRPGNGRGTRPGRCWFWDADG